MYSVGPVAMHSSEVTAGSTGSQAQSPRATARAGLRVRVAGFWRRALAFAVDGVILLVLFGALGGLSAMLLHRPLPRLSQLGPDYLVDVAVNGDALTLTGLALFAVLALAYFAVFHGLVGQTVGKRLLGIRVIDGFGERLSFGRAVLRSFGYVASSLLLLLGFLWIAFDREKRGLHDWIADTYVILV